MYIKNIVLNTIAGSHICPMKLRRLLYLIYGHKISRVYSACFLGHGKGKLYVGEGSFVNVRAFFDLGNDIIIGKNVSVGFNTTFINSSHQMGGEDKRAGNTISYPIVIEDGCWIGANVIIMPGVTIHRGCVIAAGSVIIKDCAPNSLYAGNPALLKRELE